MRLYESRFQKVRSMQYLDRYPQQLNCIIQPQAGLGGVYLGNYQAAQNISKLKRLNIRSVLTIATQTNLSLMYAREKITSRTIAVEDNESANLYHYFASANRFIEQARSCGNVLVHCMAGISRSPTIILAYLMQKYNKSLINAYRMLKQKKSSVKPNKSFAEQLRKFEEQLFKNKQIYGYKLQTQQDRNINEKYNIYLNLKKRLNQIQQRYSRIINRAQYYNKRLV